MLKEDTIVVTRDIDALLIPTGVKIVIEEGSLVMITQALGNSYTVYINGNLARVSGKDGDALGMIIMQDPDVNAMDISIDEKVWELLKTCFDPEIPVNIVDLGLVYECDILPLRRDENAIQIKMTLTAAGCGMGPVLIADIIEKLKTIKTVIDVKVDLVFDPPWSREMMSEVAKLQLGMM